MTRLSPAPEVTAVTRYMISPWSLESLGATGSASAPPTTGAWGSANRAYYIPFRLEVATTINRLWIANGTTVGTDSWDAGIYASVGGIPTTRLVSDGGHTTAGASVLQYFDITDIVLPPGAYYMAMAGSGTTDHVLRMTGVISPDIGVTAFVQASAYPLPNPATPATTSATFLPLCGVTTRP